MLIKKLKGSQNNQKGMSLLEILVVVVIFSVLGIIVTRSVLLTLRGSKRSESSVKVRENVNFSLGVMERQLRNSDLIPNCPNPDPEELDYIDEFGNSSTFSCESIGDDGYVASDSARLTNEEVDITSCTFTCSPGTSANPASVDISLTARDANSTGLENANVTVNTKVFLRTY